MKIIFNKQDALYAFRSAAMAVGSVQYQHGKYLHIATKDDYCTIESNGSPISIMAEFDAEIVEHGSSCLESEKLMKALGTMSGDITIETTDDNATIKSGRSRLKIQTISASDFPVMKEHNEENVRTISATDLVLGLTATDHAMAIDDVRKFLNGVYVADGHIVASDGHRLAVMDTNIAVDAIIPAISAKKIAKLFSIGEVTISERNNQVIMSSNGITLSTLLIDAKYPQWQRIVFEPDCDITVNKESLISAIDIAMIAANSQLNGGILSSVDGQLSITAKNAESSAESILDCESEDFSIGVNLLYLSQSLKQCSETTTIGVKHNTGIVIKDGNFREYIMAMMM